MRSYRGLLEPRWSSLTPLKSTFNAEHFIRRLSWSILNGFGALHSQNVYCSLKSQKKFNKTSIFGVQGHSRSSMSVPLESPSAVLVMISSKSVSISNHSRARLVDSSRNRTFSSGYPNLMRSYGGLLEPTGSVRTPLKSTFNAEHFIRRLSWSILNDFGAILS